MVRVRRPANTGQLQGSVNVVTTRPQNPRVNTIWVNPDTGELEMYNGFEWVPLNIDTKLFGNGSDGDKEIAADTNLDPTLVYNYKDLTINAGFTLSVSSVNTPLILLVQGDCVINGAINLDGKGGAAGVGSTTGNGTSGTAGNSLISGWTNGAGSGGIGNTAASGDGAGGGGGSSLLTDGTIGIQGLTGSNPQPGAGGVSINAKQLTMLSALLRVGVCGAGGGGGGRGRHSSVNVRGGDGGEGGGCLFLFVGGDLILGANADISADGLTGDPGSQNGEEGGGGGGGGGGTIIGNIGGMIEDNGLSLTVIGGPKGDNAGNGDGGAGAAGKALIQSIRTSTILVA